MPSIDSYLLEGDVLKPLLTIVVYEPHNLQKILCLRLIWIFSTRGLSKIDGQAQYSRDLAPIVRHNFCHVALASIVAAANNRI